MTTHATQPDPDTTCPTCGCRRRYAYARICTVCKAAEQRATDDDPHILSRPRRRYDTAARGFVTAILEQAMNDATCTHAAEGAELRAQAQWWWLDDRRSAEVYGSAAYCCSVLDLDRERMAAALEQRWSALGCLMSHDARRHAGARLHTRPPERTAGREAQEQSARERWTPEARAARSAQMRKQLREKWTPERRKKCAARLRKAWCDPNYREKVTANARAGRWGQRQVKT